MTLLPGLKRFFLARSTITALILLALASVTTGGLVPQAFISDATQLSRWRSAHPLATAVADRLGLHHIYTTPGFVLILGGAVIALLFSCAEQFRRAQRLMRHGPAMQDAESFQSLLPPERIAARLRAHGMRPAGGNRLARNTAGYWGQFFFHLGLTITLLASLLIALTQQRTLLKLTVGESFKPGQAWSRQEEGLLATGLQLSDTIRLAAVNYDFGPYFGLRSLASVLVFTSPTGAATARTARINDILHHHGIRIYQDSRFGHAFLLSVTTPDSRRMERLVELPHPSRPDLPSYEDYPDVLAPGTLLRLKYVVNDSGTSFVPATPTLSVRIDQGGRPSGTIALKQGEAGNVGGYHFRLMGIAPWTQLIFVRLIGIEAVFLGFAIMCLGGILHYFTTPLEAVLQPAAAAGTMITLRAVRFAAFYREELQQLQQELTDGDMNG